MMEKNLSEKLHQVYMGWMQDQNIKKTRENTDKEILLMLMHDMCII